MGSVEVEGSKTSRTCTNERLSLQQHTRLVLMLPNINPS